MLEDLSKSYVMPSVKLHFTFDLQTYMLRCGYCGYYIKPFKPGGFNLVFYPEILCVDISDFLKHDKYFWSFTETIVTCCLIGSMCENITQCFFLLYIYSKSSRDDDDNNNELFMDIYNL